MAVDFIVGVKDGVNDDVIELYSKGSSSWDGKGVGLFELVLEEPLANDGISSGIGIEKEGKEKEGIGILDTEGPKEGYGEEEG